MSDMLDMPIDHTVSTPQVYFSGMNYVVIVRRTTCEEGAAVYVVRRQLNRSSCACH